MELHAPLTAGESDWRAGWNSLPRWARWLALGLSGLAALALCAQFLVYVHYTGALLRFPFDYDQGEGFELYDTVLHAQGRWPYQDSQVFPFYTSIYPPVFHLLTVPLVWLFGPQLWTGRLVGFAASLVAAGALAWAIRRETGRGVIGALAGLTFLASNYTFAIGPLFRQHMSMVLFETLAIVTLAGFEWPSQTRAAAAAPRSPARAGRLDPRLFWGLFFLLAAGYTKPLAIATVIAGLGYLFLRGPRQAVLAGLALALAAGGLFAWLNWQTDGWWYISIIRANINAYDPAQTLAFFREWFELHAVVIGAALAYGVSELSARRPSAYTVWFGAAAANGLLSGKFGAGESYFVTATAAACVCAGLGAARLWNAAERGRLTPAWAGLAVVLALPALSLVQTRLTLHVYTDGPVYGPLARLLGVSDNSGRGYYDSQGYTQLGPRPTRADIEAGYKIVAWAQAAPGPVFSEEAGFLFAAGKPIVTNPFVQLVMYQAGLFDPAEEIRQIEQRAFGLVILRAQFYPPPVLAALGAHYQPAADIALNGFTYHLLQPRP